MFKSPKLIGQKYCHMGTFWKTNEVHIFERANLSEFSTWKFTAKEDLNPRKQVFLLNLSFWPAQKPNIWSFFYWKKCIWENSVVWKLRAFNLKISTLPRLLVLSYPYRIPCCIYSNGLVAGMWHLKRSSISSFNSIIYQPKKLAWV